MRSEDEIIAELNTSAPHEALMERLHTRLRIEARSQELVDVGYRTVDSPIGLLLVAATKTGLVRVAFAVENHEAVLSSLSHRISPRILEDAKALDDVASQLDQYFSGKRTQFDLALDFSLSRGFRRQVLEQLAMISYGKTASYAQVAERCDNPKAVRAVGTACATNPIPVVIPCHRVVRSDGRPGGYLGGLDAKLALLALEQIPIVN